MEIDNIDPPIIANKICPAVILAIKRVDNAIGLIIVAIVSINIIIGFSGKANASFIKCSINFQL